jgi:very-short-patch-repair endonuclease
MTGMPADRDPLLLALLARQAGVLSRPQALRYLTARMVERRLGSGRWQTAHRGVYVAHSGPIDRLARRWVAALSIGAGRPALLGGLSALETVGFRGFATERIDLLVPARLTPTNPPAGVVVHRTTILPDEDIRLAGRPPGTMPARSLIDAAQWASSDQRSWAVIAAGFQQRLVRADDIRPVLARMPRVRRRALIEEAIIWSAGGAHSSAEADFLRLCRRARLPEPTLQSSRQDTLGRRNYLDAYFPDHGLHIEIDGGHHTDVQQWWADMHRQNQLWIPGDRVLRFPAWAVRHRPDEVIAQLRAALAHPPHRPRS